MLPCPGRDSTQMRPPWRPTTFLQIARPMPVPGYLPRGCSRWKIRKIRSRCSGAMPMPLFGTENSQPSACQLGGDVDAGRRLLSQNLRALLIRFWKN